ncbi:MAG TPA: hypothetical protein VGI20_13535 [Rhizomicrobium sp.]|jgi:hypothetical protein
MTHRIRLAACALAGAAILSACSADSSDAQATALAQWKAACAAQHKQFYWQATDRSQSMFQETVKVEGKCVGPGEKGYEPPPPPDTSP